MFKSNAPIKSNRYRRLRAQEMALRNFLSGKHDDHPFPPDSMEFRVYGKALNGFVLSHEFDRDMYEAYGHADKMPTLRSPASVRVRPPLAGHP
jgi:hypothetical protein